jgi:hypothetical protein
VGTGTVAVPGTGTAALSPATLVATGQAGVGGTLARTLELLTGAGTGTGAVAGSLGSSLAPTTLSAATLVDVVGAGALTLDPLTLTGTGGAGREGTFAAQLADLTLTGQGWQGDLLDLSEIIIATLEAHAPDRTVEEQSAARTVTPTFPKRTIDFSG